MKFVSIDAYFNYCLIMVPQLDKYYSTLQTVNYALWIKPQAPLQYELPKIEIGWAPVRRCAKYRWN